MTLAELERGFELHQQQMRQIRERLAEMNGRDALHDRQMQELRDNQAVQGAMLVKASNLLVDVATTLDGVSQRIKAIAGRQAVTQAGIESLVRCREAFKKRLEGADGQNPA